MATTSGGVASNQGNFFERAARDNKRKEVQRQYQINKLTGKNGVAHSERTNIRVKSEDTVIRRNPPKNK